MNIEYLIRTMNWTNPDTGIKTELGKYLGNNVFINDSITDFPEEILLFLIEPDSPEKIATRFSSTVYYHEKHNRKFAVKKFKDYKKGGGIEQFRCLRKIKLLGFETPEVYAATPNVLVMDYIPHQNLEHYLNTLSAPIGSVRLRKWNDLMNQITQQMEDETIDTYVGNGYVIFNANELKFGVYDQG